MKSPWENQEFAELSLKNIDERFAPMTNQQVSYLLTKMNLKRNDVMIDIGCGAGRHSIAFAENGLKVTGIDISETMINKAKERTKGDLDIQYYLSDIRRLNELKLADGSYHGAVCLCESGIGVLGDIQNELNFFKYVHNILRPNAFFVFSCFNVIRRYIHSKDSNPKFNYIENTMDWSAEINGEILREKQRQYTPSEIKLLLTLCGFKNIEINSCANSIFSDKQMGIDDIEMLVIAQK